MVELASNPWHQNLEPLPIDTTGLSNDQILFYLADILDQWPGTPTAVLNDEEKHNRLVKAFAGYPDIDVATRPLDWPLHPRSVEALTLSRALDDIPGIFLDSSLRSDILNRDMTGRNNDPEVDFHTLTVACLSLLLSRVKTDNISGAQEALFSSVFSYDNTRGIVRGWEQVLAAIEKVPSSKKTMPHEPDPLDEPTIPKAQGETKKTLGRNPDDTDAVSEEEHERWSAWDVYNNGKKEYDEEKKEYDELMKYSFPDWGFEVTFQFCRIQTWLTELRIHDRGEGTCGRVLRGASLLLEAAISSIRDLVIQEHGPGSIIIDGGGRLRAIVPDKQSAEDLVKNINKRYQLFLSIRLGPNERLTRELNDWFDGFEHLEKKTHPQKEKNKIIRKFTDTGMPPRRVYVREINANGDIGNVTQLVTTLNRKLPPEKHPIQDGVDCPFCNEELSESLSPWESADGWVFNPSGYRNRVEEPDIVVCLVHRLCYIVGHYQRMKDSVLHRPRIDSKKEFVKTTLNPRPAVALAQLDGNSIGHLFKPSGERDNPASMDAYRRRSFRFNAHWWPTLADSIFSINRNGGDPIGVWVVAGDDVLLAEYGHSGTNSSARWLHTVLNSLAISLNRRDGFNAELGACSSNSRAPQFTFTAGYTEKKTKERIRPMLKRVIRIEGRAKKQWKSKMTKRAEWMLSPDKRVDCIDWEEGNPEWIGRNLIRREDWDPDAGNEITCRKNDEETTLRKEVHSLICDSCHSVVHTTSNPGSVTKRIRWEPRNNWTRALVIRAMRWLNLEKPGQHENDEWQKLRSALDRSEISKKWSRWTLQILPEKKE